MYFRYNYLFVLSAIVKMGNAKSNENVGIEPLDSDELNIIKKLWASINDKEDLGSNFSNYIFN
jgi:hypothetical protein